MKFKSFGCSFIYGSDLSDCLHVSGPAHPGPSLLTWPALIAEKKNMKYFCQAWPGSGNFRILERIFYEINDPEESFFLISWTWIDRVDYVDNHDRIYESWAWRSIMPNDTTEFANLYYRDFHSQFKDQFSTVIYIKQAIDILQRHKIPFAMTYQDDLILDCQHQHPGLLILQDEIAPYLDLFDGQTFLEWSRSHGFEISAGNHPLELAHQAAADHAISNWSRLS